MFSLSSTCPASRRGIGFLESLSFTIPPSHIRRQRHPGQRMGRGTTRTTTTTATTASTTIIITTYGGISCLQVVLTQSSVVSGHQRIYRMRTLEPIRCSPLGPLSLPIMILGRLTLCFFMSFPSTECFPIAFPHSNADGHAIRAAGRNPVGFATERALIAVLFSPLEVPKNDYGSRS